MLHIGSRPSLRIRRRFHRVALVSLLSLSFLSALSFEGPLQSARVAAQGDESADYSGFAGRWSKHIGGPLDGESMILEVSHDGWAQLERHVRAFCGPTTTPACDPVQALEVHSSLTTFQFSFVANGTPYGRTISGDDPELLASDEPVWLSLLPYGMAALIRPLGSEQRSWIFCNEDFQGPFLPADILNASLPCGS